MSMPEPYYDDGQFVIYRGDALEILPSFRAASIDLVVTDPPYVIGAVSAGNMASKSGGWQDMMNSARWFRDWYSMCRRVLTPSGAIWTFCNWRSIPVVMRAAQDAQLPITSLLVWNKDWIGPGGTQGLRPSYELVALMALPDFQIPNRGLPDIWTEPWSSMKPSGHPAEKPVPLLSRLMQASGLPDEGTVLDPFAGSGSTMRAAKDLGYRAIGIEDSEQWCQYASERLRQSVLPLEVAQ